MQSTRRKNRNGSGGMNGVSAFITFVLAFGRATQEIQHTAAANARNTYTHQQINTLDDGIDGALPVN